MGGNQPQYTDILDAAGFGPAVKQILWQWLHVAASRCQSENLFYALLKVQMHRCESRIAVHAIDTPILNRHGHSQLPQGGS